MAKYSDETIKNIYELLNNLTVMGTSNCKRVALIAQLLENPEKENEDNEH